MKEIVVVVHANGRIEANLVGFKGTECEKDALLKEIEAMLTSESKQVQKHPEYYQRQQAQVKQERD